MAEGGRKCGGARSKSEELVVVVELVDLGFSEAAGSRSVLVGLG